MHGRLCVYGHRQREERTEDVLLQTLRNAGNRGRCLSRMTSLAATAGSECVSSPLTYDVGMIKQYIPSQWLKVCAARNSQACGPVRTDTVPCSYPDTITRPRDPQRMHHQKAIIPQRGAAGTCVSTARDSRRERLWAHMYTPDSNKHSLGTRTPQALASRFTRAHARYSWRRSSPCLPRPGISAPWRLSMSSCQDACGVLRGENRQARDAVLICRPSLYPVCMYYLSIAAEARWCV